MSSGGASAPEWTALCEWAAVFVLVGLSLFWAANDYSAAVGSTRARQFVGELPAAPDIVLYSVRDLGLEHPGVRKVRARRHGGRRPAPLDGGRRGRDPGKD